MTSIQTSARRRARHVFRVTSSVAFLLLLLSSFAWPQSGDKILSVDVKEGVEGQPLTISAQLVQTPRIVSAILAYRPFGTSVYKQLEATIMGNSATATIPGSDVAPGTIEYYYLLQVQGKDSTETYPTQNAEGHPLRAIVGGATISDKSIIMLSPEPNATGSINDMFISFSLYKADTSVDRKKTKVFIDDRDVSSFEVIDGDLVTLVPANVTPPILDGPHSIRVETYDTNGKLAHKAQQSYTQALSATEPGGGTKLIYNFSGQLEARNEDIDHTSTPYDRGTLNMTSQYDFLHVNGNVYVTNEEKDYRQPQDRYYLEAATPWVRAAIGDAFPVEPSLILSGERVRGFTGNADLGFFHLDYSNGQITRKIEGDTIETFKYKNLRDSTARDSAASYGPYGNPADSLWAKYNYGTYSRNLMVVHPSFGGSNFRLGFSYLHSQDDTTSINHGIKPQEDLAVGSDLMINADDQHIQITGQVAASAFNQDITGGNISDSQIDSLYTGGDSASQRSNLKKLRDDLKSYMTINENLVPLSTNDLNDIMAYEGAISLNYFNNYIKGSYIYHGSEYTSFGQTFLQKDIQGLNLYDRIRLMQDQTFFSIGVEHLHDNTDGSKGATTRYDNFNSTLSYFPRISFPNITIGYGRNARSNGMNFYEPDSTHFAGSLQNQAYDTTAYNLLVSNPAIEDVTNRYFLQTSYDVQFGGYKHTASFGVNISNTSDQTLAAENSKNSSISLGLLTNWTDVLQTSANVGLNYNQTPAPSMYFWRPSAVTDYNYTNIMLTARYFMMENNRLRLGAMLSPTFGDFNRTSYDANAQYNLYTNLSLLGDFNVLSNPGVSTDVIWSIILKYNM
jgi:hypothetical protein